jgi:hypothetical protein
MQIFNCRCENHLNYYYYYYFSGKDFMFYVLWHLKLSYGGRN